jgi:hypothetical protein
MPRNKNNGIMYIGEHISNMLIVCFGMHELETKMFKVKFHV